VLIYILSVCLLLFVISTISLVEKFYATQYTITPSSNIQLSSITIKSIINLKLKNRQEVGVNILTSSSNPILSIRPKLWFLL